jgi:hypothetical protein
MSPDLPLWQCVNLERVTLVGCTVHSNVNPDNLPASPLLRLEVDASAQQEAGSARLSCLVRLRVAGDLGGADPISERTEGDHQSLFSIDVQYRVVYGLKHPCTPSEAELEAFAAQNGVFNAWPYLREFVQSTYYRLELPLPPLPSFTVGAEAGGADALPVVE